MHDLRNPVQYSLHLFTLQEKTTPDCRMNEEDEPLIYFLILLSSQSILIAARTCISFNATKVDVMRAAVHLDPFLYLLYPPSPLSYYRYAAHPWTYIISPSHHTRFPTAR